MSEVQATPGFIGEVRGLDPCGIGHGDVEIRSLSDGPFDGIGDGIEGEGIGDGVKIEAIEGVDGQTNAIRTDVIEFRHIVPQLSEGDPPTLERLRTQIVNVCLQRDLCRLTRRHVKFDLDVECVLTRFVDLEPWCGRCAPVREPDLQVGARSSVPVAPRWSTVQTPML